MIIKSQRRQKVWHAGALINFTAGGAAAGLYLLLVCAVSVFGDSSLVRGRAAIVSLLLVTTGFASLCFEAGNPLKSVYLLKNLRHSWMSREVLFGAIFVLTVTLNFLIPSSLLIHVAALSAFGFLFSQGCILHACNAITAWNRWQVPFLILLSGLTSGAGIWLILMPDEWILERAVTGTVLCLLLLHGALWAHYLFASRDKSFRIATQPLRGLRFLVPQVLIGQLWPLLVLLTLRIDAFGLGASMSSGLLRLAGGCILLGVLVEKHGLLLGAGSFREIVLEPVVHGRPVGTGHTR
jgi:DMSO reductase anchor subunit